MQGLAILVGQHPPWSWTQFQFTDNGRLCAGGQKAMASGWRRRKGSSSGKRRAWRTSTEKIISSSHCQWWQCHRGWFEIVGQEWVALTKSNHQVIGWAAVAEEEQRLIKKVSHHFPYLTFKWVASKCETRGVIKTRPWETRGQSVKRTRRKSRWGILVHNIKVLRQLRIQKLPESLTTATREGR